MKSEVLFVVTGPTASGKSAYANKLAQKHSRELVNADAFQFFKEIPIISNQGFQDDKPVHLVGARSLGQAYSAGDFAKDVEPYLNSKFILVGTGLYLGAALYGLDNETRKGTPFQGEPRVEYLMTVLNPPRAHLYDQINERVDQMMSDGALTEAEKIFDLLASQKLSPGLPVLKAIGLKHLLEHLRGERSLSECIDLWKRDTRRLAKRQWTWLRKFCPPGPCVEWLAV
ncbi:MAG: hypothetical protein COV44_06850 [Deltaproteobacteria bacterium CG11_big_fil_rev_8_21_14_0_20_45_16]|nr:MAG: hypothetical protein COV44_06850 [Deltaproteobacteria bacterium CG11_big_fil_rev_8_21_14_0_20_45_16]